MIGIPNPWPGCLIAFEGMDGSGKSVQMKTAEHMIQGLDLSRRSVVLTKEPNKEGPWGARIYAELAKSAGIHLTDPLRFQTWYAAGSREHVRDTVIPALQAGHIVLTDRCRLSMVYGITNWNQDFCELIQMHWGVIGEYFIWPDAIFVFDVPVAVALERLSKKGISLDAHERESVLTRVGSNYRTISWMVSNCHLVDGNRGTGVVFGSYGRIISDLLVNNFPECRDFIEGRAEL